MAVSPRVGGKDARTAQAHGRGIGTSGARVASFSGRFAPDGGGLVKGLITRTALVALAVTALLAPSAGASGGGRHGGEGVYKEKGTAGLPKEKHPLQHNQ